MTITTRFHDRWTTYDIASVRLTVLSHSLFGVTDGTNTETAIWSPKLEQETPKYDARAITTTFGGTVFKTAILYWLTNIKAAQVRVQTDNKQTNKQNQDKNKARTKRINYSYLI
jgi:hypothetical protein